MRTMIRLLAVAAMVLFSATSQGLAGTPSAAGLQWLFAYDPQGQLTRIVDPEGRTTTWQRQFDPQGRLQRVTRTEADGTRAIYTMDRFGQRATMQDTLGSVAYTASG